LIPTAATEDFGGGGATRLLPRDGGEEELHEDSTVGPHLKVWTRGQKWKWCQRRRRGSDAGQSRRR